MPRRKIEAESESIVGRACRLLFVREKEAEVGVYEVGRGAEDAAVEEEDRVGAAFAEEDSEDEDAMLRGPAGRAAEPKEPLEATLGRADAVASSGPSSSASHSIDAFP